MKSLIKKIDHFVITTDNLPECLSFYSKLGFVIRKEGKYCELYAGDFKINVHKKGHELLPHAKHIQLGSADFCFEVENIETFHHQLIKEEIEIELGIVERKGTRGIMKSIYIRDYDGNLLEFSQYDEPYSLCD